MTLRQPHDCTRCGGRIRPGEEFAAVDVLDPDGEIQQLLCPGCARELREFLGEQDRDEYAAGDDSGSGDGNTDEDEHEHEHEHERGDGSTEPGETRDDNSV